MGTWGTGAFENDEARDWLDGLHAETIAETLAVVVSKIDAADLDEYLEAPDCQVCLAAAELIADSLDKGRTGKEVRVELQSIRAGTELVQAATRAVARIRENSELKDLWQESEQFNLWQGELTDLQARLIDAAG